MIAADALNVGFAARPGSLGGIAGPEPHAVARSLGRLNGLLATARVAWLSSLRPDGRPHIVPVWFDWDGELITVFAHPDAQKIRNIRHEPRVMIAVGSADSPFDTELLEGEAYLASGGDGCHRPSSRFVAKYADAFTDHGLSSDSFAATYPAIVRIRPTRLLDWAMRGSESRADADPRTDASAAVTPQ